ncbi:MAG: nucleotidyltransferase family protein, partial [Actinomycetota bacterium]|nr:nucleotidyltransferase family protein [Actinomycetota bacterium]
MTGDASPRPLPTAVVATARSLGIDALTAEVLRAFRAAGCRAILLKGPVFRRHLYADRAPRGYGDVDLLVAPADLARSGAALASLGLEIGLDHVDHPGLVEPHAQEWGRPGGPRVVDLHWRIAGVEAPPQAAWEILSARTEPMLVGGEPAEALRAEGVALLVAVHASGHGRTHDRSMQDLERAVERLGVDTWASAARLAAELEATEAFAAGLRLVPAGERLASELGLPEVRSPQRVLLAAGQPAGSLGLLKLVEPAPVRERLR